MELPPSQPAREPRETAVVHPETDEKRTVIVLMHDELSTGTLSEIAEQAGADDFQKFLDEMDKLV